MVWPRSLFKEKNYVFTLRKFSSGIAEDEAIGGTTYRVTAGNSTPLSPYSEADRQFAYKFPEAKRKLWKGNKKAISLKAEKWPTI